MGQQKDFYKLFDPKNPKRLIAVVNLNYMFPIPKECTQKFEEQLEREIDEIQKKLDERMVRYDNHIKSIIVAAHSDTYQPSEEDSKYFIKTYGDKFLGRNPNNI